MKFVLFAPGIIWFIISTILLVIPGNDIPRGGFFNLTYFDKMVHFIMFFLLTFFFSFPFTTSAQPRQAIKHWFQSIAVYVLAYGIMMEFIQKYWVQGRSFDFSDIIYDALGSLGGMVASLQFFLKK
jgi:VanZ family protein